MTNSINDWGVVILAGGQGTRIRHLLGDKPKPLAPVAGLPFLEWVLRYLEHQGFRKLVLSCGYQSEQIEAFVRERPRGISTIECFRESQPLGTGGGAIASMDASQFSPPNWLVMNGDSLTLTSLIPMMEALNENPECAGALVGIRVPDTRRYGSLHFDSKSRLIRFEEKIEGAGWINAGVYAFRSGVLGDFRQMGSLSMERDILPKLIQAGKSIHVVGVNCPFLDIGTPETLAVSEKFIANNRLFFGAF